MGFRFEYEATVDRGAGREPIHLFYIENGYAEAYPALHGGVVLDLFIIEENDYGPDNHYPLPAHLVGPVADYLWKHYAEKIEDDIREYRLSDGVYADALNFKDNAHRSWS
jgi:hypothetical protein